MSNAKHVAIAAAISTLLCAIIWVRPIKGNGESMIYHKYGCGSYKAVRMSSHPDDRWFMSEDKAVQEGYRKAKNC